MAAFRAQNPGSSQCDERESERTGIDTDRHQCEEWTVRAQEQQPTAGQRVTSPRWGTTGVSVRYGARTWPTSRRSRGDRARSGWCDILPLALRRAPWITKRPVHDGQMTPSASNPAGVRYEQTRAFVRFQFVLGASMKGSSRRSCGRGLILPMLSWGSAP